jgi:hypothetical protein
MSGLFLGKLEWRARDRVIINHEKEGRPQLLDLSVANLSDDELALVKEMVARFNQHRAMDVALTRVADDIDDKTCPLADEWWFDGDTTMRNKIREVLE